MTRSVIVVVAAAAIALLAGRGTQTVRGTPGAAARQSFTPPAPSPVSTAATVRATCTAGVLDVTQNQFASMSALRQGNLDEHTGDVLAEAYDLTLTDTSASATAEVTGFAVVFYNFSGQETDSEEETLSSSAFLTPGQSLTSTEAPWGDYTAGSGGPAVGPFTAGDVGAVDSAATCQLTQWYPGS